MSLAGGMSGGSDLTLEQRILFDSEEGASEYLRSTWFYRAMEAIRDARIANGLSQQQVADRIGTTQSAVARLENSHRGNFSLDRFLTYAWACGVAPLDLELLPTVVLRQFAADDPGAPRTARSYDAWEHFSGEATWVSAEFDVPVEAHVRFTVDVQRDGALDTTADWAADEYPAAA